MLYFLDTCIVIYAVEGQAAFQQRALAHIAALEAVGHRFVISELVRNECLVVPFGNNDGPLVLEYFRFFQGPNLRIVTLTSAMHERAAMIRGSYQYPIPNSRRYSLSDAHHLAAAIESGCDRFLTNDNQLARFADIAVEELP
ncbi:MAG TPA: PIN domain-containing protein [Gemmataceae bacterium]|nr:PIN domain-containing protein [Gemmataceae bacterium]